MGRTEKQQQHRKEINMRQLAIDIYNFGQRCCPFEISGSKKKNITALTALIQKKDVLGIMSWLESFFDDDEEAKDLYMRLLSIA